MENSLKVATYNLSCMSKQTQNRTQQQVLANAQIDIAGLQEVNASNRRFSSTPYDTLTYFKGPDFPYAVFGKAMAFGGGGYGNAIISKLQLASQQTVVYDNAPYGSECAAEVRRLYANLDPGKPETVTARNQFFAKHGLNAVEDRCYQRVVFHINDLDVAFYNTHLSFEFGDLRRQQLKFLYQTLQADPVAHKILVGDFNTDQNTTDWDLFKEQFNLANGGQGIWYDTFTGVDPAMDVRTIDNIVTTQNIKIQKVARLDTDASDHVPLVATLEIN